MVARTVEVPLPGVVRKPHVARRRAIGVVSCPTAAVVVEAAHNAAAPAAVAPEQMVELKPGVAPGQAVVAVARPLAASAVLPGRVPVRRRSE